MQGEKGAKGQEGPTGEQVSLFIFARTDSFMAATKDQFDF